MVLHVPFLLPRVEKWLHRATWSLEPGACPVFPPWMASLVHGTLASPVRQGYGTTPLLASWPYEIWLDRGGGKGVWWAKSLAPAAALETCLPQNSKNFKNNRQLLFAFCFKRHFFPCAKSCAAAEKVKLPWQLRGAGVVGEGLKPGVCAPPRSYHGHCCSRDQVGDRWEVRGHSLPALQCL